MTRTYMYRKRGITDQVKYCKDKIKDIEISTNTVTPISQGLTQALTFQFQAAHFLGAGDDGQCRINLTTTPTSAIDEETLGSVVAYATFDDVGGNGNGVSAGGGMFDVPLLDVKGRTANYHVNPLYPAWDSRTYPSVSHTKAFIASNAFSCNTPGTATGDQAAYISYTSNTVFNISANISTSLWFYPTDLNSIGAEVFRFLIYRWIDASNWFIVAIKPSDDKVYIFTNEAAVETKRLCNTPCLLNAWNNIIFTYDPTANSLLVYLNNSSAATVATDTTPNVYSANSNLYLGGLPTFPAKRFTGYIDNFVFWSPLILTTTQVSNMWTHGTIV